MSGVFRELTGEDRARRRTDEARQRYSNAIKLYNQHVKARGDFVGRLQDSIKNLKSMKLYGAEQLRSRGEDIESRGKGIELKGKDIESRSRFIESMTQNLARENRALQGRSAEIGRKTADYKGSYEGYMGDVGKLGKEREILQSEFESFKQKAPALEQKISDYVREYEGASRSLQDAYRQALQRKEDFRGLAVEDLDIGVVKEFEEIPGKLKAKREQAERDIEEQLKAVTFEHGKLESERGRLKRSMQDYQGRELGLRYRGQELSKLGGAIQSEISQLESLKEGYKTKVSRHEGDIRRYGEEREGFIKEREGFVKEQEKFAKEQEGFAKEQERFAGEYGTRQKRIELDIQKLKSVDKEIEDQRRSLGIHRSQYEGEVADLKEKISSTNLISGIAQFGAAALTGGLLGGGLKALGAPAFISKGVGDVAKVYGLIKGLSTATSIPNIPGLSDFQGKGIEAGLGGLGGGLERYLKQNLSTPSSLSSFSPTPISSGYLGTQPKVNVPELGNLPQSLEHFGMPMLPKLAQLPKLQEALGKVVSKKDIESLTLGLPRMASGRGKTYTSAVLYDPSFLKKLKRVSRAAGKPYLKEMRYA